MQKNFKQFMLMLTVIAVILASVLSTTTAYADDGTTGDTPPPAAEETSPAEETTPAETVEEAAPAEETIPAEIVEEAAPAEETLPAETMEGILEQIPEGTEIVVLNEGDVEPLATQEAVQIILQDDPVWCPGAHTPGDAECTAGDLNVTALLAAIAALPEVNRTGPGTIYFTANYAVDDATFDHDNTALSLITDLTIQGGWDGDTGIDFGLSGFTTFSGFPLAIRDWTGDVTLNNIIVDGEPTDTGLYVETTGDIVLNNTSATNNGFDGADLINYDGTGDVTVTGGNFSGNDQAGLYIASKGIVSLNNVTVDNTAPDNSYDGAIVDNSYGTGDVTVTGSTFSDNLWTGLQVKSAGTITLNNVTASGNSEVGAYLNALSGPGNIFLNTATFNSNGDWGVKAFTGDGSITATNVLEDGNGITKNGAWYKSYHADVTVNGGSYNENISTGLLAVAGGQVNLNDVTATTNGGDGVEVYSIYNFACFGTKDIVVNVDDGTYQNNGGYGIYAEPGAAGSVNFTGTQVFSGNGLGDVFVNPFVNPCPKDSGKPNDGIMDSKPLKIVNIPETGIDPVEQDCENFSGTLLELPSGTSVKVGCPFTGNSNLIETPQDQLPGELPASLTFASAVTASLGDENGPLPVMDEGGLLTISFVIPEELLGKRLSILYWDPTANGGLGDWIELPLDQFGGESFPLHPDDPDDGRKICSGMERSGNKVSVTLNFPGVFALVAR